MAAEQTLHWNDSGALFHRSCMVLVLFRNEILWLLQWVKPQSRVLTFPFNIPWGSFPQKTERAVSRLITLASRQRTRIPLGWDVKRLGGSVLVNFRNSFSKRYSELCRSPAPKIQNRWSANFSGVDAWPFYIRLSNMTRNSSPKIKNKKRRWWHGASQEDG